MDADLELWRQPFKPLIDDNLAVYHPLPNGNHERTQALKNLWRGCAAFFVCGGPSGNAVDYMRLAERGVCSLGLNNVAGKVPVKAVTFNDPPEKFHHAIWRDPAIIKLLPRPKMTRGGRGTTREKLPDGSFKYLERKTIDYPNVWAFERRGWHTPEEFFTGTSRDRKKGADGKHTYTDTGLCAATCGNADEGVALTGRPKIICSMFMGLRLLHYLGVRRVYLLGVDFHMHAAKAESKLGNYAFEQERDADAIRANNDLFNVSAPMLTELRPHFEKAGFYVFNTNPMSYLRAFDYVSFEDAMQDCRNGCPDEPYDLGGWYVKGERSG